MSGEPEDCDCGPDEPPDPEPGCGDQGGAGCCTVFECVNLLEGSQGQNWVQIAQYPSVENCSTGDSSACTSTNGELDDPANDAGTNYLVWSPDPCPCNSPNVYKYVLTQPGGPGTCSVCSETAQCVAPDYPNAYDTLELCCEVAGDSNEQIDPPCPPCTPPECPAPNEYRYVSYSSPPCTLCSATPQCVSPTHPNSFTTLAECVTWANGYNEGQLQYNCEQPATGPLSYLNPVTSNQPCIEEDCLNFTATWVGVPYGEEVTKGLYRLQWDLIDDCPGACCAEPPKEPELGNDTIFVTTPCKCDCQEG